MRIEQTVRDIIVLEYFSCVLLAIIFVYALMEKNRSAFKQVVFRASVAVTIVTILITITTLHLFEAGTRAPVWLLYSAATLYQVGIACSISSITAAMVVIIYEYRTGAKRLKVAAWVIVVVCAVEIIAAVSNLWTGWLFTVNEKSEYVYGPASRIDLIYLLIAFIIIEVFYRLECKRVKRSFRLIVYTLPALAVAMGSYQYFYMRNVLTCTILSLSLLVVFIYGQQQRLHTDPLTDLSNREAFFHALQRLSSHGQGFRVTMIGVGQYKLVNSQFGQRAGDAVLREVGAFLSSLDPRAAAYRFTGVEFALVAVDMPEQAYEKLFRRVTERFQQQWESDGASVMLHATVSDIRYPDHASSVDELIAALEYSMRIAKRDVTRGGVLRFDAQLRSEFGRRNYVLSQLEDALKEDNFFIHIQPVYDCCKKRFTGGEVLLRLNEKNGRPISPGEFIPLAIEAGIATELGWMVLEKTCRFISENRSANVDWLSVNISSQQNEFDETVRRLELLLEKYNIPPKCIKLEITERVLLDDMDKARATINELGERGVGVFLDDFGTGYSNLVNMMSLPFECIKIDKGLVRGITRNPKAYGLLQTVINGIRAMRTIVLAEGVETHEQDEIVHRLGIDFIQGYYYARPVPQDEFLWLIRQSGQAKC